MSRILFSRAIAFISLMATTLISVGASAIAAQAQQPIAPVAPPIISFPEHSPEHSLTAQTSQIAAPSSTVKINPFDLQRARNLARQTAERVNGGLELYRADPTMHGPTSESPFMDNGNGTVTFTFTGGSPGYSVPSIESVITVNTTSWVITVDYNGVIQQSTQVQ